MPDLMRWSVRVIFSFTQVREHFIDALDEPAELLFCDVLGNQFFHEPDTVFSLLVQCVPRNPCFWDLPYIAAGKVQKIGLVASEIV